MVRKTIIPSQETVMLTLPGEMVGKEIDVYIVQKDEVFVGNINNLGHDYRHTPSESARQRQAIAFFEKISVDTGDVEKYSREDLYE